MPVPLPVHNVVYDSNIPTPPSPAQKKRLLYNYRTTPYRTVPIAISSPTQNNIGRLQILSPDWFHCVSVLWMQPWAQTIHPSLSQWNKLKELHSSNNGSNNGITESIRQDKKPRQPNCVTNELFRDKQLLCFVSSYLSSLVPHISPT
ncbi:uncharacterized protein YALI1_C03696g [Yarrowia lipolytica]|uniref:Uncharacterized protein n=1 Tax=Yarrowia lipolytica TaxID=4952 RepID=A0A1D8N9D7_YARLL|nr:hypothetical protein YALI1_C03696g [Yarrowia lipolytica]